MRESLNLEKKLGNPSAHLQEFHVPCRSGAVLKQALQVIYGSQPEIIDENVQELVAASDYLGISGLKNDCCECLQGQISLETCCPVLAMARQYNCWELAEQSMQYILRRFEDIMQSEHKAAVQQLSEDVLLEIVRDNNLEAGSETNVLLAILLWVDGDFKERASRTGHLLSAVRLKKGEVKYQAERDLTACSGPAREMLRMAAERLPSPGLPNDGNDSSAQSLPARQSYHTSLLAVGGHDPDWRPLRAVEMYSPARDVWEPGPPMPPQDGMSFVSGATLGRHLYIVGEAAHVSQRVLALDRASQIWQSRPFTLIPRAAAAVAAASSTLYVVGGRKGTSAVLSSVEAFSVEEHQWQEVAELCSPRAALAAAACQGRLYALGGQAGKSIHKTIEEYHGGRDCWQLSSAQMQTERKYLAAACLGGRLLAVGGMTGTRKRLATVEAFDPREGRWQHLPPMSAPRSSCAVASLHNRMYVVGGTTVGTANNDIVCDAVEAFDLHAGRWTTCAALCDARTGLAVAPM
ncbi:hypothetical protein WJX74_005059 [Apatococcus lobatus]|uniref:BACK domain-containing protein n=2 Tax=Apatococcus TaxID=904362 RepID=A0AAW1T848_9CHLO